jgi:Mg/Co/Ni transporter MgtE
MVYLLSMKRPPELFESQTVESWMHDNFITLDESVSVSQALEIIRGIPDDGRVIYYYTKDAHGRLTGVVPVRKLMTAAVEKKLKTISKKDIVKVSSGTTMDEVARVFTVTKYLSLPVALLAGVFEQTLQASIIIAFFITLVLALGESVAIQSMSIALQTIHVEDRTGPHRYLRMLSKEVLVGLLLGASCGAVTFALSAAWKGQIPGSIAIGASITLSIVTAACIGISVPSLLHALHKDPRIASGPLALACTDISTILIFLTTARLVLS